MSMGLDPPPYFDLMVSLPTPGRVAWVMCGAVVLSALAFPGCSPISEVWESPLPCSQWSLPLMNECFSFDTSVAHSRVTS